MKTTTRAVKDIIAGAECPLPLNVIPNSMGINLCSVESLSWTKQADDQLVSLTINFKPHVSTKAKAYMAYSEIMENVDTLSRLIETEVEPCGTTKPRPTDLIPKDMWRSVCFTCKSEKDKEAIASVQNKLADLGISFDHGYVEDRVEWSIDWSLSVAEGYRE